MINKYTNSIMFLQCWNTAARKHPTERENDPYFKKGWKPLVWTSGKNKSKIKISFCTS
jgi:hypothetical protein